MLDQKLVRDVYNLLLTREEGRIEMELKDGEPIRLMLTSNRLYRAARWLLHKEGTIAKVKRAIDINYPSQVRVVAECLTTTRRFTAFATKFAERHGTELRGFRIYDSKATVFRVNNVGETLGSYLYTPE